jgi:hypothetical protein
MMATGISHKTKKDITLILSVLIIGLIYTGIIILAVKIILPKQFDMNIYKYILSTVSFVILLPLLETIYCNIYLNKTSHNWNSQMNSKLRLLPEYQYIFSFISIIPAIDLSYTVIILLRNNVILEQCNSIIRACLVVISLFLPYIVLNIIYRKFFIKGNFKINYYDFLWIIDFL